MYSFPEIRLLLADCAELTAGHTSAALDALVGLDFKRRELVTGSNVGRLDNGVGGAVLCALAASDTLVLVDDKREKVLADACRALLVSYMSDILVAEVAESRENRVGRRLTERAERRALDEGSQLFETVDVLHLSLAVSDLV